MKTALYGINEETNQLEIMGYKEIEDPVVPMVTLESYDCGRFKVFINGKHMKTVQKFNISGGIGEVPLVKLEFLADVNIK